MSKKNSNKTVGNRTCEFPTCSAVPQTAIRRDPSSLLGWQNHENMGSTCSTNGTRDKSLQFLVGKPDKKNLEKQTILQTPSVYEIYSIGFG